MSPDIRSLLQDAAPAPRRPLDIGAIGQRARTLGTRHHFIVVLAATATAAFVYGAVSILPFESSSPSPGDLPIVSENGPEEEIRMSLRQRAAVVSLEALTDAGMRDPSGDLPDYVGVKEDDGGWIASFARYDCSQRDTIGTCIRSSSFDIVLRAPGTEVGGSYGDVTESGSGSIEVVAVTGDVTDEERSKLIGYRSPIDGGEPRQVYLPFHVSDELEDGHYSLTTAIYWSGPIPARMESSCHVVALDANQKVIYEGRVFEPRSPSIEGARDGMLGTGLPSDIDAAEVRLACDDWTGRPPPQRHHLPDGPWETMAEGSFPDEEQWGDYAGASWRLAAATNGEMDCVRLEISIRDGDDGSMCMHHGQESPDVLGGSTHAPVVGADGSTKVAYLWGSVDPRVALVRLELSDGGVVETVPYAMPEGYEIEERFYLVLLPMSESAQGVGLDADGAELGGRHYCFTRDCIPENS